MRQLLRWIKRTDRKVLEHVLDVLEINEAKIKPLRVSEWDALGVYAAIHGNSHDGVCRLQAPSIGHEVDLSKARVHRAINALEVAGLIRRETSGFDARRKDIYLTA